MDCQGRNFMGAHTDGYFAGAMDNASGIAVGLEMAEYYSKMEKLDRQRTITFFLYPDHHHGEYSVREKNIMIGITLPLF